MFNQIADNNTMIGTIPMAEGESWFTQADFVPSVPSAEARPKQPWDSYKPEFWLGFIAWRQQPLSNLPYFWGGWDDRNEVANYSYFTPLQQQAVGVAYQQRGFTAPVGGIYTGTDDPCAV